MNKKLTICLVILVSLIFSACNTTAPVAEKNGEMIRYTMEDIRDKEYFGFYVKNKDNTFTPVMRSASGYDGQTTSYDPSRYIWYSNTEDTNLTKLIPKVKEDQPLVGIFESNASMPDEYTLEKYNFQGSTIGCDFNLDVDGQTVFIDPKNLCRFSEMEDALTELDLTKEQYRLESFTSANLQDFVPWSNIDTDTNKLVGLDTDKLYRISFFIGTKYKELQIKADTRYFKSSGVTVLSIPFDTTKNGYFNVNLPDNLTKGFYYINDIGLFEYESGARGKSEKLITTIDAITTNDGLAVEGELESELKFSNDGNARTSEEGITSKESIED